jgi:hypothetical protein
MNILIKYLIFGKIDLKNKMQNIGKKDAKLIKR